MRYLYLLFWIGCAATLLPGASALAGEPVGKRSVLIELDGSGSYDPDGDDLQFRWTQVGGPTVALSDPATAKPYFRTTEPGLYVFELVVSDATGTSAPLRVEVEVERENLRPEARAPESIEAMAGESITLDGSGSRDADGDTLAYEWRQFSGPPLYLSEEQTQQAKLTLHEVPAGIYEFDLTVNDGKLRSKPVRCRLVVEPQNTQPVAKASSRIKVVIDRPAEMTLPQSGNEKRLIAAFSAPEFAQVGDEILLDGSISRSLSKAGGALRYYWKQRSGPFVRVMDRKEDWRIKWVAREEGDYVFELVVSDGERDSPPVTRTIHIVTYNAAPVAVAQAPERAEIGTEIKLDGSKSYDRENEPLSFSWRQVSGPRVASYLLTDPRGDSVPSFLAQNAGEYVFELVVNDGERDSRPAQVTIQVHKPNAPPSVQVAGDLVLRPGERALLQGRGRDEDGDALRYEWKQLKGPPLLQGVARQQSLLLLPEREGAYLFEFTATDGKSSPVSKQCWLTVTADADGYRSEMRDVFEQEEQPREFRNAPRPPQPGTDDEPAVQPAIPQLKRSRWRDQNPVPIPAPIHPAP